MNNSTLETTADVSIIKPESLGWYGDALEYSSIKLTEEDIQNCLDYVESFKHNDLFGIFDDSTKAAKLPKKIKLANVLKWKNENQMLTPTREDSSAAVSLFTRSPKLVTYSEFVNIFAKLPPSFKNVVDAQQIFSRCYSAADELGRLPMLKLRDFFFEMYAVVNHWRALQEFADVKVGWLTEKELKSFFHHLISFCDEYETIRGSPRAVYVAEAFTSLICFRFEVRDNGSIEIRKLLCTKIIQHAFNETINDGSDIDRIFFTKERVLDAMDTYLTRSIDGDGFTIDVLSLIFPDILPVFFNRYMSLFGHDKLYFLEFYRLSYALDNLKSGKSLVPVVAKHLFECIDLDSDGYFTLSDCAIFHEHMMSDLERSAGIFVPIDDYYDSLFDLANVPRDSKISLKNLQSPAVDSTMFFNMLLDMNYMSNMESGGGNSSDSAEE